MRWPFRRQCTSIDTPAEPEIEADFPSPRRCRLRRRHDGQHRWSGSIPLANGEERVLHTSWGPNFPNGRNGRRNDDAVSAVLNAAPDPPVDYEVKGPDPDQWPVLPEADPAWLEKE